MKSLEDGLRDVYRAVTDSIREEDLPGLYEKRAGTRRNRFSVFVPLAAAVAVVVAIGIGVAVPKLASSPRQPVAPATASARAVTPPFVVILNKPDSSGYQGQFVVVNAKTGRITGKVPDPGSGTTWSYAATTGNGTTFVVAASPLLPSECDTYLYTLTLSASGAPASLKPWTVPVVRENILSITASADGDTVAFVADQCRDVDQAIGIIRGGVMKTWQEPYPMVVGSLSMSADGSLLAYSEVRLGGGSRPKARLLDTGARPGSATAASKIMYAYPAGALVPSVTIGPDGATAYIMWNTGQDSRSQTTTLAGYRIGPGGVRAALFREPMPSEYRLAWAGNRLLVGEGPSFFLVDPATGTTTRLQPPWSSSWEFYW